MQLIVLGMHRSGTSSVTRLLNLAGAWFGEDADATETNEENPKGFWERRDVREVCDGLLLGGGYDWWRLADLDLDSIPATVRDEQLAAMADVVDELDRHRPWVVKEPRLCLLLPLLRPLLDAPVGVIVTRDPVEVAQSVRARSGFPIAAGLALWEVHLERALDATADLPRVHVRYEDLMADPVGRTARLVDDLTGLGVTGLTTPPAAEIEEFITPSLRRQRPAAGRDELLNSRQSELAAAADAGTLLDVAASTTPSAGAREALETLADDQDRRALVADMEAAARVDRLRTEDLRRRLGTSERVYQELRQRAARPLWMIAGSRSIKLARAAKRRAEDATAGTASGPDGLLARGVAGAEGIARRLRAAEAVAQPTGPVTVARTRPAAAPSGRPSVAVIAWDVGHNPLGRAMVMAEVLARRFDVEIWGAQFERYGTDVWAPLRDSEMPINVFEGRPFPAHLDAMEQVAGRIEADAVWVSKPRLPSYALGLLAKQHRNRPVVLDVDDRELSFFAEDAGLDSRGVLARRGQPDVVWPFERTWTRACDQVIVEADAVTVSNPTLQHLYGGTIVPHARDEKVFDPALYDRAETRARLGFGDEHRLLLFGGTPRAHKGVLDVLRALDRLGDERYRLLVFGPRALDEMRTQIGDLARWVAPLPDQPFSDLARTVHAADLACVLQDPTHPVTAHQLPAKITDALAMGVPCLVTPTAPLAPLLERGVLQVWDPGDDLHERIARIFDDPDEARTRSARGRKLFLEHLSYEALAEVVAPIFEGLLDDPPALTPRAEELIDLTHRMARATLPGAAAESTATAATLAGAGAPAVGGGEGRSPSTAPGRPAERRPGDARRRLEPGAPFDLVVFWKQNDTGIYGRRQDMFLKYLLASGRVERAVHFDNPVAPEYLAKLYLRSAGSTTDHSRLIMRRTIERVAHRRDDGRVLHRTFLHAGGASRLAGLPPRERYLDHVRKVLRKAGVGDRPLVLWGYPSNLDLPELIDGLQPDLVVTDVVDDNRTWSRPGSALYARIEGNYADVLRRSDVVIANCRPVVESMAPLADEIHLVPNGLELPDALPDGPRPPELAELSGPIVGYVGNLSSRLDIDLIEAIARARPQWQIVLIGSTHLDRSILRLEGQPNVHFPGVRPYDEALTFVRHFDVGIIPHLDNEMTRAMNPLKAFVYAAAGVPVVSTPIANIGELGDLIRVAEGRNGFLAAIEEALAEGRVKPDPDRLAPESWAARVDAVLALIDAAAADPAHPAADDASPTP